MFGKKCISMLKYNTSPLEKSSFVEQCHHKTAALFLLRGSYTNTMRNLALTKSAKLWPCSKVWWQPSETDVGQYGSGDSGQGSKGKSMYLWQKYDSCPPLWVCWQQKWAWKAEASGFPLPKQLTLSLQKDTSISWREAMRLTVFCKPNMKQEGRDRKEQKMKAAFEAFRPFFLALKSW